MIPNYTLSLAILFFITGCNSDYYSTKDFQSVHKIDSHVHINSDRGLFEIQSIKDNFSLVTINVDESDSAYVKTQFRYSLLSARNFPSTVFYATTFHFDTLGWNSPDWSTKVINQLKVTISGGAISVKIYKNIGMSFTDKRGKFIMVDNAKISPIIDFIIATNLAITGHLGEPRNCWLPLKEMTIKGDSSYFASNPQYHMYKHPDFPSYDQQLTARDHLLDLHPDLRFVGCHLGSLEWNVDELAKRLDRYPNMAVDMAARISHLQYQSVNSHKKVRDFLIKYQDRLLYGTDLSDEGSQDGDKLKLNLHDIWSSDWRYFTSSDELTSNQFNGKFQGLRLPREVIDKIYFKNAIKWYQLRVEQS